VIDAPHTLTLAPEPFSPSAPTRRACEAACILGFSLDDDDVLHSSPEPAVALRLPPGSIALLTGPSGAGKSTLLRAAERAARARSWRVIRPEQLKLRPAPLVDLFDGPVQDAMRALAHAGLAEARCFVRRPAELSAGQQARLRLALAFHRAARSEPDRPTLLALDEFAALLDPASAFALARLLRAFVSRQPSMRAVVATSNPALAGALRPDVHLERTPSARWRPRARPAPDPLEGRFEVRPARPRDLRALEALHYRAAPPARRVLSLALVDTLEREIVAALVVVMPTLNASWRALAWPGRFDLPDKRAAAHALNAEVRRIARVVVDPRWRSLSLATRLVRHYLASPLTPCTEAVAAMGRCLPFFRAAGMTEYPLAPSARDARLLDALAHAGVEPWRLASPRAAWTRAARTASEAFLERETRLWARASSATAHRADHPDPLHLFRLACRSLAAPPVAYAHTHTTPAAH
jgi:ABC-type lipoprotein export system ATPase subunit